MRDKPVIAIIDDDVDFAETLSEILEDEAYIVENLGTSLDENVAVKPDVVLLDLWLGNRQSVTLIDKIRTKWDKAALIMMSSDQSVKRIARSVKANDALVKPFRIGTLLERISQVV